MAILDIVILPLASSTLPVENSSTPVGRLWDHILQSMLAKDGIIHVAWGQVANDRHILVLFTSWTSLSHRENFHKGGLGVMAIHPYLRSRVSIFYADLNDDHTEPLADDGTATLSRFKSKSEQQPGNSASFEEENASSGSFALWRRFSSDFAISFSKNAGSDESLYQIGLMSYNYKPEAKSHEWMPSNDVEIPFTSVKARPPAGYSDDDVPTCMSQLFTHDERIFGKPYPPDNDAPPEMDGPSRTWRSPEMSYQLTGVPNESNHSQVFRGANGYEETVSLGFSPTDSLDSDEAQTSRIASLDYQKSVVNHEDCLYMYLATWSDKPQRQDLLISWRSRSSASSFHTSTTFQFERTFDLSSNPNWPLTFTRTPGFPFRPSGAWESTEHWAEMVDLILPTDASDMDRTALDWHAFRVIETLAHEMVSSPVGTPTLSWIDPVTRTLISNTYPSPKPESQSEHTNDTDANKPSPTTYRILFSWDGRPEEKEWVRQFASDSYMISGHRAHWSALLCEKVEGRHVVFRRVWRSDFGDQVDEIDEDLGF